MQDILKSINPELLELYIDTILKIQNGKVSLEEIRSDLHMEIMAQANIISRNKEINRNELGKFRKALEKYVEERTGVFDSYRC